MMKQDRSWHNCRSCSITREHNQASFGKQAWSWILPHKRSMLDLMKNAMHTKVDQVYLIACRWDHPQISSTHTHDPMAIVSRNLIAAEKSCVVLQTTHRICTVCKNTTCFVTKRRNYKSITNFQAFTKLVQTCPKELIVRACAKPLSIDYR